jgi:hypothetical protein
MKRPRALRSKAPPPPDRPAAAPPAPPPPPRSAPGRWPAPATPLAACRRHPWPHRGLDDAGRQAPPARHAPPHPIRPTRGQEHRQAVGRENGAHPPGCRVTAASAASGALVGIEVADAHAMHLRQPRRFRRKSGLAARNNRRFSPPLPRRPPRASPDSATRSGPGSPRRPGKSTGPAPLRAPANPVSSTAAQSSARQPPRFLRILAQPARAAAAREIRRHGTLQTQPLAAARVIEGQAGGVQCLPFEPAQRLEQPLAGARGCAKRPPYT